MIKVKFCLCLYVTDFLKDLLCILRNISVSKRGTLFYFSKTYYYAIIINIFSKHTKLAMYRETRPKQSCEIENCNHFSSQSNFRYELIKSEHIFHTKTVFEFQLNKVKQIIFITYYIKLEK